MTSPLERAARALCENPSEDPDELIMMMNGEMWPRWRAEVWRVKSVLTAIREPSEGMGSTARWRATDTLSHEAAVRMNWQEMIDAALKEG